VQGSLVVHGAVALNMVEVCLRMPTRTNGTGNGTLGAPRVDASFAPGTYVGSNTPSLTPAASAAAWRGGHSNLPASFHTTLSYDATMPISTCCWIMPFLTGFNGNQQKVATR